MEIPQAIGADAMRLIDVLELRTIDKSRRDLYLYVLVSFICVMIAATWFDFYRARMSLWLDFQYFYEVGRLAWQGQLQDAYYTLKFEKIVHALGDEGFLPWTYPPQFALIMATMSGLTLSASYVLFMIVTLGAYLLVLNRLNPERMVCALFLVFPSAIMNARIGQNGFLIGALVGWAGLLLLQGKPTAGLPLGFLVIKPHMAASPAIYAFLSRNWLGIVTAMITVTISCVASSIIFGSSIWPAFFNGVKEASIFLEYKTYPLYSMVSLYATLRTLGASSSVGFLAQGLQSVCVLASIAFASQRLLPRQTLGLAIVATLLISPYANSYDATIIAAGFALIFDDIIHFGHETERLALYFTSIFSSGYALASTATGGAEDFSRLSPSGLGFLMVYILCFRILLRSERNLRSI